MKLVLDVAFIVYCCLTKKKILAKHLSKMFDIYIHIFVKKVLGEALSSWLSKSK